MGELFRERDVSLILMWIWNMYNFGGWEQLAAGGQLWLAGWESIEAYVKWYSI